MDHTLQPTLAHRGQHLGPAELEPRLELCPICRATHPRRAVLRLQKDPVVELLRCPRCRACSASHMPTAGFLDGYYARYGAALEDGMTFGRVGTLARRLAREVTPPRLPPRMLDFGGGRGALARAVAESWRDAAPEAIEIHVVDYGEPFETRAGRVAVARRATLEDTAEQYDLVLASAVLEHVPDLGCVLPALFRSVRPGGWFYARTPWIAPFAVLPLRVDFGFPAHVHDLGHAFWRRTAATFGMSFETVWSRPSPTATRFLQAPLRTLGASLSKLPGRLAAAVSRGGPLGGAWPWVGGWEVLLRRAP